MAIDIVHFRSKRQISKAQLDRRTLERADTRRKYELGELVMEMGLGSELSTVLLGMLSEAKAKLDSKDGHEWRRRWWAKGDKLLAKSERQA